jgi:hypothetical protein
MLKKSPSTKTIRNKKSDDGPKLRAEWVATIQKAHAKNAAAIIELGRILNDAKQALEKHGQWQIVFEQKELPFSLSLAERYMKIARDHRLTKSANLQNLPSPVSVLYELSRLSDDEFYQAMAAGKIHPEMTHKEAAALAQTSQTLANTILGEIADAIDRLEEVQHDVINTEIKKWCRDLADRLITWGAMQ